LEEHEMRVLRFAGVAVVVAGCGGGGDGGNGTQPPVPVASVTITPSTNQSMVVGGAVSFSAQPKDAQSNDLSRTVTWTTSDQAKVSLSASSGSPITATGVAAGFSDIRATSEGMSSSFIRVTVAAACSAGAFPCAAGVEAGANSDTFTPGTVNIAVGGTVTWTFGARAHNVIFSGTKPSGGDINPAVSNTTASRTFRVAGSFGYACTVHPGMNGTVVVH
jgi:plastocyanin